MHLDLLPLLGTGFLFGWSVAWPPGPINAEIARRCLARGFWAGFGLLLGACTGDALWALLVALGIGALFTTPMMQAILGSLSMGLLMALAFVFLRGAWDAVLERGATSQAQAPSRFDSHRASYGLGLTMALTSPWNVAFWLGAVGRPEMTRQGTTAMLVVAAAVIAGALTWGLIWSGAVVALHRHAGGGKWWAVGAKAATGLLMLYFASQTARSLFGS